MPVKEKLPIDVLEPSEIVELFNVLLTLANTDGDRTPSYRTGNNDVSVVLDYVLRNEPKTIHDLRYADFRQNNYGTTFASVCCAVLYWLEAGHGLATGKYADIAPIGEQSAELLFDQGSKHIIELGQAMSYGIRGHNTRTVTILSKLEKVPSYSSTRQ